MPQARITLIGMEQELIQTNRSITDSWLLENESFDVNVLMSAIIAKGGRFEVLYSDPDFYYIMCSNWWLKWSRTFLKWFNAFDIEYNPLENYDRFENWHDDILDNGTNNTTTANTEVIDDDTTSSDTITNDVSAYDSSSYSPKEKTVETGSGTDDRTTTNNGSINNAVHNDRDLDHNGRIHGNIGVTTSQQMLQSELDIQRFNIYDQIADIFCNELLIRVF